MSWSGGREAIVGAFLRRELLAAMLVVVVVGCHGKPSAAFTDLTEARRLAADIRVQFNRASDASDRAVLADTDGASVAFARQAEELKRLVESDAAELDPRLRRLGHAPELMVLDAFARHLADYEKVDRDVLELAVENTNLKAQRLSFGPARQAADAFRDALTVAASSTASKGRCHVDALVAKAVMAVREIQILQAPHIAESDDAVMTRLEKEMAALEATARDAARALAGFVDAKTKPSVAAAAAALDKFAGVSRELVRLSRRNSNVRSLELSLRAKPASTAACDDSLRGLQDALAKEALTATR